MENIIICPNEYKMNILKSYEEIDELHSTKFMDINTFKRNYFFDYDSRAISYLIDKYDYNIDVCKIYLDNLYVVDVDKDYKNKKLIFLRDLKKELINEGLLTFNNSFREYIKKSNVKAYYYYDLDKYLNEVLDIKYDFNNIKFNKDIYKFNSIEDEVRFLCIKIRELIDSGVDINNIYLCNVNEDYYYILDKMFSYFNIPINIPYKDSIYSNIIVQDYLKTGELDLDNQNKYNINKLILNVLADLAYIDPNSKSYRIILENNLKDTYITNDVYSNAVNIKDLKNYSFSDDDYVFLVGFNLDIIPKVYEDIDFITDKDKSEVSLYDSNYKNIREKGIISYLLSNIKNLFISYKLSSPFQKFYPSNLIDDLGLKEITFDLCKYNYSETYNKILLGEMLDKYYVYGEKDKDIDLLNSNYSIDYNSYSNKFSGINHDKYLENISYPLKLSYSSLNSYYQCSFKYYIDRVLKIGEFSDTFEQFVGNLYHEILSLYNKVEFDFDKEWNKYLENRELSLSEKVLLVRLRKDLIYLLDVLKKQKLITGYDEELHEENIEIPIKSDVSVIFTGFIDKIMYYKKVDDTYYAIVDYKTGEVDTHLEPLKYGLHMQLPIYLYLISKSKKFNSPIFTGIYYQNILFDYPNFNDLEKSRKENYLLKGYSTDNTEILEVFDSTFQKSELIKSMSYSEDTGFSRFTKLINGDDEIGLIKYTEDLISDGVSSIIEGDFQINPKIYDYRENVCERCSYQDLCFKREDDYKYLDKVSDLGFLGGDE